MSKSQIFSLTAHHVLLMLCLCERSKREVSKPIKKRLRLLLIKSNENVFNSISEINLEVNSYQITIYFTLTDQK